MNESEHKDDDSVWRKKLPPWFLVLVIIVCFLVARWTILILSDWFGWGFSGRF